MFKKIMFLVFALSLPAHANAAFWGEGEASALQDADWKTVVSRCQQWTSNKESQIQPHDQEILCSLTVTGMQQVDIEQVEKSYLNTAVLSAKASNGKGQQKSEAKQEKSSTSLAVMTCPVMQNTKRVYSESFHATCESVASGRWKSKIHFCQDKWSSYLSKKSAEEVEKSLKDADLQTKSELLGNPKVDCNRK